MIIITKLILLYLITETLDCPRMISTHPPFPNGTPVPPVPTTDDSMPPGSESNDNVPSTDDTGNQNTIIIAVVVVAIVMLVVLSVLISILIGIVLFKKRTKDFTITHTNLQLGIANQLYGTN